MRETNYGADRVDCPSKENSKNCTKTNDCLLEDRVLWQNISWLVEWKTIRLLSSAPKYRSLPARAE